MKVPRSKSSRPTVTGDAKEAWSLIALARDAGVDVASVSVGSCRVELRQSAVPSGDRPAQRDPRQAIYEQFGGEAFRRMTGRAAADAVPGEDYQPALESEA